MLYKKNKYLILKSCLWSFSTEVSSSCARFLVFFLVTFFNSTGVYNLFTSFKAVGHFRDFCFSGFSILMESSGCADLPLTMTMLSLWPWHHSRLWIINRGLDPNGDGLFVGKQGVISLSRQSDLMAHHKYIKRGGIAVISSDPNFGPTRRAIVGTFGLSGPISPVKSYCSGSSLWESPHLHTLVMRCACLKGQVWLLTSHTNTISIPSMNPHCLHTERKWKYDVDHTWAVKGTTAFLLLWSSHA